MDEQTKNRNKKIWIKIGYLLLNVIIVGVLFAIEKRNNGEIPSLGEALRSVQDGWTYVLLAFMMFVGMVASESICLATLIYASKSGFKPVVAINTALLGKYYDYITPFATGGQPFQMAYLAKHGIEKSTAYSIPLAKHAVRRTAVCFTILFLYIFAGDDSAVAIKIAAYLGLAINMTLPVLVVVFLLFPRGFMAITGGCVKLGYKWKLVKNYEKTMEHIQNLTQEFLTSMRFLSTNKFVLIIVSIFSLTEVLCQVSVPFLVLRAFDIGDYSYWDTIIKGLYTMNASSYVPTPGSAGGAEALFYALYNIEGQGGGFFWAIMLWRAITYYLFLVIGILLSAVSIVKSIKKAKRANSNATFAESVKEAREEMEGLLLQTELQKTVDILRTDEVAAPEPNFEELVKENRPLSPADVTDSDIEPPKESDE